VVLTHDGGEVGGHRVDLRCADGADRAAGHRAVRHPPLRIEREPDMRLHEVRPQLAHLAEEVTAPRLDIQHDEDAVLAGGVDVLLDLG